jgi:hypothetical protein
MSSLFYPFFIIGMFIVTLLLIPRDKYKKFVIYGLITGAVGDTLFLSLIQKAFGLIRYTNNGIFDVFGMNYLVPPAWALVHMVYLYFLPVRKLFLYPYIALFAFLSEGYGIVIHNLGLFDYNPIYYYYFAPIIFFTWWGASAWFFRKMEEINMKAKV